MALIAALGTMISGLGTSALAQQTKLYPSQSMQYKAPAGNLPTLLHYPIDGFDAAVLPNGRFVTPFGTEFSVGAPKPFGLAVSPDGNSIATVNSGISPFSVTLISNLGSPHPLARIILEFERQQKPPLLQTC